MAGQIYIASPTAQLGEAGSGIYAIREQVKEMESDLLSQMKILNLKSIQNLMAIIPSYQSGISYVPKTGLAIVHRGEEIRSRSGVSMSGITIGPFNISGSGDAKETANQILKALKYRLKGELNDLLA